MNQHFTSAQRIFILIITLCIATFIAAILTMLVRNSGSELYVLRVSTVIQDCVIFILPALVTALLISPKPLAFLCLDRTPELRQMILALMAMIVSIPAMNYLVMLNNDIVFPESLRGVEEMMRQSENRAQEMVDLFLSGTSVGSLIINILIIGLLAAASEELLFRGALQGILWDSKMNRHAVIWVTAFIFSAFHMQFFGFFPRLILGAYFGYLLVWSRSLWLPMLLHFFNNSIVVVSTWSQKVNHIDQADTTINNLGVESPILIIASVILTFFVILQLKRVCGTDGEPSSKHLGNVN